MPDAIPYRPAAPRPVDGPSANPVGRAPRARGGVAARDPAIRVDRTLLVAMLAEYTEALTHHDVSSLPVAPNVRVTDNGEEVRLGDGPGLGRGSAASLSAVVRGSAGRARR